MITKKMLCESLLKNYANDNDISLEELLSTIHARIHMSSILAVSADFLGLITETRDKNYCQERDGILFIYYDTESKLTYTLTVRELLELLPNKI